LAAQVNKFFWAWIGIVSAVIQFVYFSGTCKLIFFFWACLVMLCLGIV